MPKIQPVVNYQEFERALLIRPTGKGKPKKIALGKNLYLVTSLKPIPDSRTDLHHAFQLRIFGNGQDRTRTIGHLPEMTYAIAREKADKEWAEQKKAREEGREAERARLYEAIRAGKMPTTPLPCFESIKNAAEFIGQLKFAIDSRLLALNGNFEYCKLFPTILSAPIEKEEISDTRLQVEIYLAIWLMLLMPTRANALIDLSKQIMADNILSFWSSPKKDNHITSTSFEYISAEVRRAINTLQSLESNQATSSSNSFSPNLFHHLSQIKGNDRREKITKAMRKIWPEHPIQTNRFKAFFVAIAIQHSKFQMEFIKKYIEDKPSFTSPSEDSFQLMALAEWWGWQLGKAEDIFKINTSKPAS